MLFTPHSNALFIQMLLHLLWNITFTVQNHALEEYIGGISLIRDSFRADATSDSLPVHPTAPATPFSDHSSCTPPLVLSMHWHWLSLPAVRCGGIATVGVVPDPCRARALLSAALLVRLTPCRQAACSGCAGCTVSTSTHHRDCAAIVAGLRRPAGQLVTAVSGLCKWSSAVWGWLDSRRPSIDRRQRPIMYVTHPSPLQSVYVF